jgi:hypothetical protein
MGIIYRSLEFGVVENDDLYVLWKDSFVYYTYKRKILSSFFIQLVSTRTDERNFIFFISSLAFFVHFLSLRLFVRFISSNNKINAVLNISLSTIAFLSIHHNSIIQLFRRYTAIGMFIIAVFAFKKKSLSQVILMMYTINIFCNK